MENHLAPIALLAYNRPTHLEACLSALAKNELASQSFLYIFIDKVKDESDKENIKKNNAVIKIAQEIKFSAYCKIILREENFGIEKNTISAVTELINKYNKVIVLEDDLIVSNSFLNYMNAALTHYENEEKVMQIGGCNLLENTKSSFDSILLPICTSWGWGTWKRVWSNISFESINDVSENEKFLFDIEASFPYFKMFKTQLKSKKENTWDILFWKYLLRKKGLVLYPRNNLVYNMGFDGSGIHYTEAKDFKQTSAFNNQKFKSFPSEIAFEKTHLIALKHTLLKLHQPIKNILINYIKYFIQKVCNFNKSMVKYYKN
jgi:hypothetical protein